MGKLLPKIPSRLNWIPVPVQPFVFRDLTHQEFVDLVNEELPIKFVRFENLIKRVAARYPLIPKHQVAFIVWHTFRAMRNLILLGGFFRIRQLLWHTHLLVVASPQKGVKLAIRQSNPRGWKKGLVGRFFPKRKSSETT